MVGSALSVSNLGSVAVNTLIWNNSSYCLTRAEFSSRSPPRICDPGQPGNAVLSGGKHAHALASRGGIYTTAIRNFYIKHTQYLSNLTNSQLAYILLTMFVLSQKYTGTLLTRTKTAWRPPPTRAHQPITHHHEL